MESVEVIDDEREDFSIPPPLPPYVIKVERDLSPAAYSQSLITSLEQDIVIKEELKHSPELGKKNYIFEGIFY